MVRCGFGRGVRFAETTPHGPFELHLDATDGAGNLAAWLDDAWWTEAINRWGDEAVTVLVRPTPDALTHPVILHQLDMLRRVAPGWRLVGIGYRGDLAEACAIPTLAAGPYHELRIVDADRAARRPDSASTDTASLPELFARFREELEIRRRSTPVLVRIPPPGIES